MQAGLNKAARAFMRLSPGHYEYDYEKNKNRDYSLFVIFISAVLDRQKS